MVQHPPPSQFVQGLRMRQVASSSRDVDVYETLEKPYAGSPLAKDYAFGGLTTGQVVVAAYHSLYNRRAVQTNRNDLAASSASAQRQLQAAAAAAVDRDWAIYSCLCTFLGPTSTHSTVRLDVTTLRSTRSFETRVVRVLQPRRSKQKSSGTAEGSEQGQLSSSEATWTTCFVATIDFCRRRPHVRHPATGEEITYSVEPNVLREDRVKGTRQFDPSLAEDMFAVVDRNLEEGKITKEQHRYFHLMFGSIGLSIQLRWLPGGLCEQTLQGAAPLDKEALLKRGRYVDVSEHVDGVWFKTAAPLQYDGGADLDSSSDTLPMSPAALAAAFRAMILDPRPVVSAPLFHGLSFGKSFLGQSLDSAIRFHSEEMEEMLEQSANDFHYVESISRVGGHGRYLGESSCFDVRGRLVATCSQQCNLAVLPIKAATGKRDSSPKL